MYSDVGLLIDGVIRSGGGRAVEAVIDPATGQAIGAVTHASDADLDEAMGAAERAFGPWAARKPVERSSILRKAAALMRERGDAIATALTMEQGKPLAQARGEVESAASIFEWNAEEGRRTYGRVVPGGAPGSRQLVVYEPVGVSLAFTPWNFPALTPARKIAAALAAGCTLVLKASEETPATAAMIGQALVDAGLPAGVLNLVFGHPADVSSRLINHPAARKLSFTGSIPVGKSLMKQAADHMLRTTMELGGHGPVIIFDDADADAVAVTTATAKFNNAGQVCISPSRYYVHDRVYDRFVARYSEIAAALKVGSGLDADVGMGPLINARRLDAMDGFVADAVRLGATVRTGGGRIGNSGFFFEPTVLADVPDDARVMTEEPFGPVVPITRFEHFDEVVARANALPFGLAAYAFTESARTASDIGRALKSGMVGVNTLAVSTPETPFGGLRESGHGQEGGTEGLQAYLDVKMIAQA
jgi:succinate-semialdehyde dehydrogenase/glutarate-semialdehyde dehydrogenase